MEISSPQQLQTLARSRRRELGLTQQDVADRARVSRKTISELENGRASNELPLLLRILAVLELRIDIAAASRSVAVELGRGAHATGDEQAGPVTTDTVNLDQLLEGTLDA